MHVFYLIVEQYFIGNKIINSVVSAVVKQRYLKPDTKLTVKRSLAENRFSLELILLLSC